MKSFFLFLVFSVCFVSKSSAQTIYTLDSINTQGSKKSEFYYDQFDRHISTLSYQFGGPQGPYVLSEGFSYVYDNNNNIVEQVFSSVQNSLLTPDTKTLLYYDAQNQVSSITNLWFDASTSIYWNSSKIDYIRNANGEVVNELIFEYLNSWILAGQKTYNYVANNAVEVVFQNTNDNGATFNNVERQTYAYNANNFPTERVSYSWTNSTWDSTIKTTYAYDATNNVIQTLEYLMNNSNWDPNFKEDLGYNSANDFILYESFMMQGINWSPLYKQVNTFDTPLLQDLIVPTNFSFNSKLDIEQIYESVGPVWSLIRTSQYNYSEEITNSIASLDDKKMSVYPVPSNDILNVLVENESKQAKVFNAFGKLLLEVNLVKGLNQLSMEGLSTGTYFINDETNNLNVRFIVVN
jgi:hypothetical protein